MATPLKYSTKLPITGWFLLSLLPMLAVSAWAQALPTELNIVVVQGEGATNPVRQATTSEPIVRIEDQDHKPVSGATVVFTLPTEGVTGNFGNGRKMLVVTTDMQGRASARGLKVNEYPGKLIILVSASYRGLTNRANITQTDEGPPVPPKPVTVSGGGHGKLIAILVIVGGAAAGGGIYFATHHSGSSSSSGAAAIGIMAGTPTIAAPTASTPAIIGRH